MYVVSAVTADALCYCVVTKHQPCEYSSEYNRWSIGPCIYMR